MASALKLRGKKNVRQQLGFGRVDYARSQSKHVGIVVLSRRPRGKLLGAQGAAYALDFVGNYTHTYTRAAYKHAALAFSRRHALGCLVSIVGIIESGRRN